MKAWLRDQLAPAMDVLRAGALIVVDPDDLARLGGISTLSDIVEVAYVDGWVPLRRLWDLDLRRRPEGHSPVVVVVVSSDVRSTIEVPWDIEHEATTVVELRWPVRHGLRDLFLELGDRADLLVEAVRSNATVQSAIAAAFGIRPGDTASELDGICRLRLEPSTSPLVWSHILGVLQTPLAREIAEQVGDVAPLQRAWNDWLERGDAAAHAVELQAAPAAIVSLLAGGLLTSAPSIASHLPTWTAIGAVNPDPANLVIDLIAAAPPEAVNLREWIVTAAWWGQVRSALADVADSGAAEYIEQAWVLWEPINDRFQHWLSRSYGTSLQSAAPTPRSVHQVAPFLARRVDGGARVLLVILDGLGFAQWTRIRAHSGLRVAQSTGCLAMIPTLTTISRQSILAGALPADFPESLRTTSKEPARWAAFWQSHGVSARDVRYERTVGRDSSDVPQRLDGRVVAVVVNALDDLMHGADVLGDAQLAVSVDLWVRHGFLIELVRSAVEREFEVWITSDHGNLPTLPGPVPREGHTVDSEGTRVRLYPNAVLREGAAAYGTVWDPPGLPSGALHPLFPIGRRGYHTTGVRVSHGGTSLDEVIVPFVQVGK